MGWSDVLLKLNPLVIDLVGVAEKAFDGVPKSGEQKKAFVHQAAQDILSGGKQATTGGAKDTWDFLENLLPPFIDTVAGFFYSNPKKTPDKIPDTSSRLPSGRRYN